MTNWDYLDEEGLRGEIEILTERAREAGHLQQEQAREVLKINSECNRLAEKIALLEIGISKAIQLCIIATDWNLCEVEIDGEMISTYTLQEELKNYLNPPTE